MKLIITFLLLTFFLVSCGNDSPTSTDENIEQEIIQLESTNELLESTADDIKQTETEVQELINEVENL